MTRFLLTAIFIAALTVSAAAKPPIIFDIIPLDTITSTGADTTEDNDKASGVTIRAKAVGLRCGN